MEKKTFLITVRGLVQGVGYRPFIVKLLKSGGHTGYVINSGGIVRIKVNCDEVTATALAEHLKKNYPEGAVINDVEYMRLPYEELEGFKVGESDEAADSDYPVLPADVAICENCRRELFNPASRRYGYYFISCAACGPRYTIMKSAPYDRKRTAMEPFELCTTCAREYYDTNDIRAYAQTISCKNCGPRLIFRADERTPEIYDDAAFNLALDTLRRGGVIAVKDTGGYHLACDGLNAKAVAELRRVKARETKPFALMLKDIDTVKKYAHLSDDEAELLESPIRPIVLLARRKTSLKTDIVPAEDIFAGSPDIGAILPSTGLQYLLAEEFPVLVLTSANRTGEPMIADDEKMKAYALPMLYNDREIINPADDSIMRIVAGRVLTLRRARGLVPVPVELGVNLGRPTVFAAGADMKAAFGFGRGSRAYISRYLGDMLDTGVQKEYQKTLKRLETLHGFKKKKTVCDMHPDYVTTRMNYDGARVQHHMAHAAAVIAEFGIKEPALCFAYDGTGLGIDRSIWGSEVFEFDGDGLYRKHHFDEIKLPGGNEGVKNANLMLAGYIKAARDAGFELPGDEGIYYYNNFFEPGAEKMVYSALSTGINTVKSTSCGRVFDAMSALLKISDYNDYEGKCAIELEWAAREYAHVCKISGKKLPGFDEIRTFKNTAAYFAETAVRLSEGEPAWKLSYEFHLAVAKNIVGTCLESGVKNVVLSGGCFANVLLLKTAVTELEKKGFKVFVASAVPPGDDGIAIGQMYLAQKL